MQALPLDAAGDEKIGGVGDKKLERYGEDFIAEIKRYLDETPGISRPAFDSGYAYSVSSAQNKKKSQTVEETYEFFRKGISLEDIAKLRNLAPSTIAAHMERLIMEGRDVDLDRLVDPAKRLLIEKFFLSRKEWGLNPVVEHFTGTISYEEARLVRARLLRKRQG